MMIKNWRNVLLIILELKGGLGNQLYQYASALSLAKKNRSSILMDKTYLSSVDKGVIKRGFELNKFNLGNDVKLYNLKNYYISKNILIVISYKIIKRFIPRFKEKKLDFDYEFFKINSTTVLDGYFQSYKYFDDIKELLVLEFKNKEILNTENIKMLSLIRNSNSVCMHIRRGDYVTLKEANEFHGLCNLSYYSSAMKIIDEKVDKPIYFLFSDDVEWCRNNFSNNNIVFVDINSTDEANLELNLMKNCKYFIIANSSFSWWAAWLSEHKNKIVLAPKRWFASADISEEDRFPKDWIIV